MSNATAELTRSTEEIKPEQIPENKKKEEEKKDELPLSDKAESSSILEIRKLCCIFCGRPADYLINLVKYQSRPRGPPRNSFLFKI